MRRIIVSVIFLSLVRLCMGQPYATINYSIPEGLPSTEVYEVYQDKKNFLWFATDNGVVRFDGYALEKFNVDQGLSDPVVFGFHEDPKGRIWFRTFSGKLSYFDYNQGRIIKYQYNDKLTALCHNSFLWTIQVDSLDQLWFGTNSVWGRIDSAGKVYENKITKGGLFYTTKGGTMYGAGPEPFGDVYIDNVPYPVAFAKTLRSHPVMCALHWRNKFYFSCNLELFEFDGSSVRKVIDAKSGIISLSLDRQDNLWVGYYDGAERFSTSDFKNPLTLPFLKGISITEVIQDHELGLWITTVGKGVFYVPDFNVKNQSLSETSKILTASVLNDLVVISQKEGEMLMVDKKNHSVRQRKQFGRDLYSHYIDHKKNIWVATNEGTWIFDSTLRKRRPHYPIIHSILNFHEDKNDVIWSIDKARLISYDKLGKFFQVRDFDFYYRSMLMGDSLNYLAARTGIHVYDKDFNMIKELTSLADYKFSNIVNVNDSILLLTSIGDGFFLLNKRSYDFIHYNSKNKFIANDIYTAITVDSTLWLGTEKGVIRAPIKSLLKQDPTFQILTQQSGLIADKANFLLEVDDQIWAFFDHGYSAFPKNISLSSRLDPVFYIRKISANDQPLETKASTELRYDQNNLTVDFGFIAFSNQNVFARYRLTKENSWSYTTERSLKFYALSPGTYKFEVEYAIDNTHWSRAQLTPQFIILSPWWQTWYFQSAVALFVVMIIFIYFRNQVNTYRKHQRKLIESEIEAIELERSRIAKDLHDSVGTDFSAIKMVVSQVLKKHNDPKSEEIETQFQNTIQDIKSIIYDLSPPGLERYGLVAGLKNYVEKLNSTIPIKIELHSFGPDIKESKLNITIFRILQELISNSLKHSEAQTIALHVNSFEDLLNIVYEDNGKGFSWQGNHKGLGLYNIESRVQSINGQLKFESGAFGISYTIDIPLKKNRRL